MNGHSNLLLPNEKRGSHWAGAAAGSACLLMLFAAPAAAQPGRATLSVSATVVPACTVSTRPGAGFACSGGAPESVTVSTACAAAPLPGPGCRAETFPPRVENTRRGDVRVVTITY
jgi:hypothetical protein